MGVREQGTLEKSSQVGSETQDSTKTDDSSTHTHKKKKKNAAAENEETSKADTAVSSCPFFLPASSYIQNAFNYTTDQRRKKKDRSLEQQQGKKEYQRKRRVEAAHNTLKDVTAKRYV
jgi:hypothetical protein